MTYLLHLAIYFGIYATLALSLNVVIGYGGMLTLAHAGYYALGAYCYAIATVAWQWPAPAAASLAVVVAVMLSLLLSLPAWRLKGDFFVMASLAVQTALYSTLQNWSSADAPLGSLRNLTNGPFGISDVQRPWNTTTSGGVFAISIACFVLVLCLVSRALRSPWGRVLQATRDDELAARGLGKNTRLIKVQAVAMASGMAAAAGVVYAVHIGYVDPSLASLDGSILLIAMVVVGGMGNLVGPLVGTALLLAIPEGLRMLALPDQIASDIRVMAYGLLLVLMMHLRPQGLAGTYRIE